MWWKIAHEVSSTGNMFQSFHLCGALSWFKKIEKMHPSWSLWRFELIQKDWENASIMISVELWVDSKRLRKCTHHDHSSSSDYQFPGRDSSLGDLGLRSCQVPKWLLFRTNLRRWKAYILRIEPHVHTSVWWKGSHDGHGWCRNTLCEVANFLPHVHRDHSVVEKRRM